MKLSVAAVLEPSAVQHRRIAEGLKGAGLRVSSAKLPEELKREQVVVLGPTLKKAPAVAKALRAQKPRLVLLAARTKDLKAPFADAVLPLPVSPRDLKVRLPELSRLHLSPVPESASVLDPLTNFYTFAHFKEVLFIEVKRAKRYGLPLSMALVAFDRLPPAAGKSLKAQLHGGLALAIRRSLRDTDLPVQYEPERVLLLMPHTDLSGAVTVARRICERVGRATLTYNEEMLRPTVSVGVAAGAVGRDLSFADMVRRARESLSTAQQAGGNRVEFFDMVAAAADDPTTEVVVGE